MSVSALLKRSTDTSQSAVYKVSLGVTGGVGVTVLALNILAALHEHSGYNFGVFNQINTPSNIVHIFMGYALIGVTIALVIKMCKSPPHSTYEQVEASGALLTLCQRGQHSVYTCHETYTKIEYHLRSSGYYHAQDKQTALALYQKLKGIQEGAIKTKWLPLVKRLSTEMFSKSDEITPLKQAKGCYVYSGSDVGDLVLTNDETLKRLELHLFVDYNQANQFVESLKKDKYVLLTDDYPLTPQSEHTPIPVDMLSPFARTLIYPMNGTPGNEFSGSDTVYSDIDV